MAALSILLVALLVVFGVYGIWFLAIKDWIPGASFIIFSGFCGYMLYLWTTVYL